MKIEVEVCICDYGRELKLRHLYKHWNIKLGVLQFFCNKLKKWLKLIAATKDSWACWQRAKLEPWLGVGNSDFNEIKVISQDLNLWFVETSKGNAMPIGHTAYPLRRSEKWEFRIFPKNQYGKIVSMCIEATQKISLKSELF